MQSTAGFAANGRQMTPLTLQRGDYGAREVLRGSAMSEPVRFILALHTLAAIVTLIMAIRDRLRFVECLRWTVMGFMTGLLGLGTRARLDREQLHYMHVIHDTLLNLALEVIAVIAVPRFLR